jgi:type IV pilus assembly protein PilV
MKNYEKGVGLIEVLVTVLILATSLLALSAMQLRSLQFNHSAYLRSQVNIFAYDMIDRMRLTRPSNVANPLTFNRYVIQFNDSVPGGSTVEETDIREWRTALANAIPDGLGQINCTQVGFCTVDVKWTEPDGTTPTFTYTQQL